MFNGFLYGGPAVGPSPHSCSAALLQLSLRNCCRCFCRINLSYPPRKLSNKTIQRGPQRVQNSNIKWQGSEISFFVWRRKSTTCFRANLSFSFSAAGRLKRMSKNIQLPALLIWQRLWCYSFKMLSWLLPSALDEYTKIYRWLTTVTGAHSSVFHRLKCSRRKKKKRSEPVDQCFGFFFF